MSEGLLWGLFLSIITEWRNWHCKEQWSKQQEVCDPCKTPYNYLVQVLGSGINV